MNFHLGILAWGVNAKIGDLVSYLPYMYLENGANFRQVSTIV